MEAPLPATARTPQGSVEFATAGNGPAVLALHGGMGGYDQGLLLARCIGLAPARAVAVSRPGYLGTPLGSGGTPVEQADLCAALLDHLGIGKALAIAVSAGGPCALHFALRHPARCAGLVLVSACSGPLSVPRHVAAKLPLIGLAARLPWLAALLRRRAARDPGRTARRSIRDADARACTLAHPEAGALLRALQSDAMRRLAERLPGTRNDIANFAAMAPIPIARIAAPILVVHGTADRSVPFAHAERVAAEAAAAEILAIEGGEHVCIFTHLDAIRARVRSFIERLSLAPEPELPELG